MKADGGISGHHNFPVRHELPSPEHVLERIRTITGELEALQAEIYGQITDPGELLARRATLERAGASGVIDQFKSSIDHMRSILWFCDSRQSDALHDHQRQLARATELLNALAPQGFPPASAQDSGSFFERLDRVIDNYVEAFPHTRHSRRSKA